MTMAEENHNRMSREERREHRRRRLRRAGKKVLIRSVWALPSLMTLGNAICGLGAMYIATLDARDPTNDRITRFFTDHHFSIAGYLIFLAMVFDALDGRLARFTRHTTDFGGQLDSLADVISFGVAPAFVAMHLFRDGVVGLNIPVMISRLVWAIGALYASCAAIRLARFNVSNKHGEQHHFSFLGLPSPGAGGAVAAFILMQQELEHALGEHTPFPQTCVYILPVIVLLTGLLMVSHVRYPHLVNKYLRGRKSPAMVVLLAAMGLAVIVAHKYALAAGTLIYVLWGPTVWAYLRIKPRPAAAPAGPSLPA